MLKGALQLKEFKSGKVMFYSDFGVKHYCKIKLIKITKKDKKRGYFLFEAEIIENSKMDNSTGYYDIGTIHGFSNAFIFPDYKTMAVADKSYKKQQMKWLVSQL